MRLESVLSRFPQIEEPTAQPGQKNCRSLIMNYLLGERDPVMPKVIANSIGINVNTVRRNCNELKKLGFVTQPNKTLRTMFDINQNRKVYAYTVTADTMLKYLKWLTGQVKS